MSDVSSVTPPEQPPNDEEFQHARLAETLDCWVDLDLTALMGDQAAMADAEDRVAARNDWVDARVAERPWRLLRYADAAFAAYGMACLRRMGGYVGQFATRFMRNGVVPTDLWDEGFIALMRLAYPDEQIPAHVRFRVDWHGSEVIGTSPPQKRWALAFFMDRSEDGRHPAYTHVTRDVALMTPDNAQAAMMEAAGTVLVTSDVRQINIPESATPDECLALYVRKCQRDYRRAFHLKVRYRGPIMDAMFVICGPQMTPFWDHSIAHAVTHCRHEDGSLPYVYFSLKCSLDLTTPTPGPPPLNVTFHVPDISTL